MADLNDANRRVRELVRVLLGMPANSVRPANQNAPAGAQSEQFATVLVTTVDKRGWDDARWEDEAAPSTNVKETAIGQRRIVASVQFFRGDAYTKATRLEALLQMSGAVDKMQAVGLGLVRVSTAKNLTAVVDTYWEERGQIDVEFHLVTAETVTVPTFGRFPVEVSTEHSTQSFEVTKP